jgi:hypothetical protein
MNHIRMFLHCRKCLDDFPGGMSRADYLKIEAGWTERGLQIWCRRHDVNIVHIDFEGAQHPADLSELGDFNGKAMQH